jgi:hypothetical protein
MFTPYVYHHRRGSTLTFEIRDGSGRVVHPGGLPSPSVMRTAEDDILRIDCENSYNIGIDVVRNAFYRYTLPPGRYQVKAVLTFSMRSLAARFTDLRDYAARSVGQTGRNEQDYFLDAVVESNTIEIGIK